jgi:dUTPase
MRKVFNMATSASGQFSGKGVVAISGPKATVEIKAFREGAIIPKKATESAAGYDLCAWLKESYDEQTLVSPHSTMIVPTGLNVNIPNGYEIQIRPRSGLAAKCPQYSRHY